MYPCAIQGGACGPPWQGPYEEKSSKTNNAVTANKLVLLTRSTCISHTVNLTSLQAHT